MKAFDSAASQGDPEVAVTANIKPRLPIEDTPDKRTTNVQSYAEKALATKPDSPEANFAEGIALDGRSGKQPRCARRKSPGNPDKADQLAKAAGNEALALSIEGFIKANLKGGAGGGAH